jgi:hypothetical protein
MPAPAETLMLAAAAQITTGTALGQELVTQITIRFFMKDRQRPTPVQLAAFIGMAQ